jgi:hypothetical protein
MINNFKKFVNLKDTVSEFGALHVEHNFSWVKSFNLPKMNLDLPTIEKKSKIHTIIIKKNPIYIQLDDGSKLFFTHDEFKRIHGEPLVGKTMTVKMIRLPGDKTDYPSKIQRCEVN